MTPYLSRNKRYPPLSHPFRPRQVIFNSAWLLLTLLLLLVFQTTAKAHGGKTHTDKGIAAFEALQTAMDLYDRLLAHGKLDESWETGLVHVEIISPDPDEEGVYTIQFRRNSGEPESVYFFLSPAGEYVGSNFTGP